VHINAATCPGCEAKMATAHPTLVAFFTSFRAANPDAHVSCSSRTQSDQEADYAKGVSKAHWGQSAHDFTPSRAIDWFRLTQAGGASFDSVWFRNVLAPAIAAAGLVWGGNFSTIRDLPHCELPAWQNL
jgi:hypothetical protein